MLERSLQNAPSPKPKVPPHPMGYRCDQCRHWLRDLAQEVYVGPGGQAVPVAAARAQGLNTATMPKVTTAPCTLFPTWSHQPGEMYCWQFKPFAPSVDKLVMNSAYGKLGQRPEVSEGLDNAISDELANPPKSIIR